MTTLFFAILFFHVDAKDLPLNVKEIKGVLSLRSFKFPQILSKLSEHTYTKLLCCRNENQFFY